MSVAGAAVRSLTICPISTPNLGCVSITPFSDLLVRYVTIGSEQLAGEPKHDGFTVRTAGAGYTRQIEVLPRTSG
jgi:hypothetical protein